MAVFSPFGFQTLAIGSLVYEIAREDLAGDPSYFLYLNSSGAWVIQKRDASAGTYTYAQGKNSASTYWGNRSLLTYAEYNTLTAALPSGQ